MESAYAILGLYYAFSTEEFENTVVHSLPALSEAALALGSDQGVVVERPASSSPLPTWHHCVIPQVVWTRLRILGPRAELGTSPLPDLLAKCVNDMWREQDKTWFDPSRNLSTPYLAADMLRVMSAYSREVCGRYVAPELAVRMANDGQELTRLRAVLGECEQRTSILQDQLNQAAASHSENGGFVYPYASRLIAVSSSTYWVIVALLLAGAAAGGIFGGIPWSTAAKIGIVVVLGALYLPVIRRLDIRSAERRIGLLAALATIAALIWALGLQNLKRMPRCRTP